MTEYTQIWVTKKTKNKLDKYQKKNKLRTRNDAVEALINQN